MPADIFLYLVAAILAFIGLIVVIAGIRTIWLAAKDDIRRAKRFMEDYDEQHKDDC